MSHPSPARVRISAFNTSALVPPWKAKSNASSPGALPGGVGTSSSFAMVLITVASG